MDYMPGAQTDRMIYRQIDRQTDIKKKQLTDNSQTNNQIDFKR